MGYSELESRNFVPPTEEYVRSTGVFRVETGAGEMVTGISANRWEDFESSLLSEVTVAERLIVSPELITVAGMDFGNLESEKGLIEERVGRVVCFSKDRPGATFVLGTPLFVNESRPQNSVLLIKDGEIIGVTNKRSGATLEENKCFDMIPEESPLLLPDSKTCVVICSDLPLASMYSASNLVDLDEILRLSGKENLIGKSIKIIHEKAETVLLVACWSVGGRFVEEGKTDQYYRMQLTNIAWRLMRETKIKEVVVVDRVPLNLSADLMKLTPTKPFNGVLRIK